MVSGRVQGVGFRYFTQDIARREGLTGIVRNLADGRVEVVAEGDDESLTRLEAALRRGHPTRACKTSRSTASHRTGRYSRICGRLTADRHGTSESQDSARSRFPEARDPVLRHHDAPQRSPGIPRHGRRAGSPVCEDNASNRSSASRAAASSSARAVASRLNAGFVPIRKPGKLPSKTHREDYALEYGADGLEIHEDAFRQGQRVLIVDDVLATGGTARAAAGLVRRVGGELVGLSFLIELNFLNGRDKLDGEAVHSVLQVLAHSPVAQVFTDSL